MISIRLSQGFDPLHCNTKKERRGLHDLMRFIIIFSKEDN